MVLSWTSPSGLRFEQTIAVDNDYLFTVQQRVVNAEKRRLVDGEGAPEHRLRAKQRAADGQCHVDVGSGAGSLL